MISSGLKDPHIRVLVVKEIIVLIFFFSLSILFTREILFAAGTIGHNWDWYIPPLNDYMVNGISLSISTWSEHSFGFPRFLGQNVIYSLVFLLGHIGINGEVLSRFVLVLFPTFSAYGAYRLFLSFKIKDDRRVYFAAIIVGLFYGYSAVSFYWLLGGSLGAMMAGVLIPPTLIACHQTINSLGKRRGVKDLFSSRPFLSLNLLLALISIASVAHAIICCVIVIFSILSFGKNKSASIKATVTTLLASILAVSSSIIPPIWYTSNYPEFVSEIAFKISNPQQYFIYAPQEFLSLFFSSFFARDMYLRSVPSDLGSYFVITTVSLVILVLGFSFFNRTNRKDWFGHPLFWLGLFLTFLSLSLGDKILGEAAHFIYSNQISIFLRSFVYYQTIGSLAFAILIGFILERKMSTSRKSLRYLPLVFLAITVPSFFMPWYSGDLGRENRRLDFDGTLDNFVVQDDYIDAMMKLERDQDSFSILAIPMTFSPYYQPTSYQRSTQPAMDNRYVGAEPSLLNSNHGIIVNAQDLVLLLPESRERIDAISRQVQFHVQDGDAFTELLGSNNIKYILISKDTQPELNPFGYDALRMREAILDTGKFEEIVNGPSISLLKINSDLKPRVHFVDSSDSQRIIVDDAQNAFWSATNNDMILSEDFANRRSGQQSLAVYVENSQQAAIYHYYQTPLDISRYSHITIDLYSKGMKPVILKIEEREKGYFFKSLNSTSEWNTLTIPLAEFKRIGSPDLAKIDNIQIEILSDRTDLHVDRLYLSSAAGDELPIIKTTQHSTDRYTVKLSSDAAFNTIILQQSYHPSWILYEGDVGWFEALFKEPYKALHAKLGHTNAWVLDDIDQPRTFTILYYHQSIYNLSLLIVAVFLLILFLLYVLAKKTDNNLKTRTNL